MRRRGQSRQPVAPVLLESWRRCLSWQRLGLQLCPISAAGRAGLWACLSAIHISGVVVSLKFVISFRSESLRSRDFSPLARLLIDS